MLKTVLYQTRIMLGEAGGINSEFGQFAQFASKQLQVRCRGSVHSLCSCS